MKKRLLTALVIVLLCASAAMAMDTTKMLMLFWGNTYEWILELTDDLEMLDTLEMN